MLVSVLLLDNDVEEAWAEAQAGGCRRSLWLDLATLREDDHPDEVIPLWQDEVARTIPLMGNAAYAKAVEMLELIERLMRAAGWAGEFAPYVGRLAMEHGRKRNLMKLFAVRGWGPPVSGNAVLTE